MRNFLLLGMAWFLSVWTVRSADSGIGDVTAKLEDLGIPHAQCYQHPYPRNVWALKAFDGKLFLGAGNSANSGPAQNAGPVPVMVFDPKTKKFTKEWDVPDEQIDIYRVINGDLCVPGHDPKEDWKFGNFYRRPAGDPQWEKVRSIPGAVHCYDITELSGMVYAGGTGLWASENNGKSFQTLLKFNRYYAFLTFPETVYAVADGRIFPQPVSPLDEKTMKPGPKCASLLPVCMINQKGWTALYPPVDKFIPNADLKNTQLRYKIYRTVPFKGKVLYIAGIAHNDHQIVPISANVATDGGTQLFNFSPIKLPDGAMPWDFTVVQDKAYLLFAQKNKTGKKGQETVNHLWESADGGKFTPLMSFKAATFARSVEYLDGYFYFGLGTEFVGKNTPQDTASVLCASEKELSQESGRIYRIKYKTKK